MSVSLSPNLPANVVEIGNEISQAKIDEINAGTLALQTWVTTGFAPKASPTFTGTVTIPAGASISGYLTTSSAASTYQTISGMSSYQTVSGMSSYLTTASASSTYAPKASPTFTGTVTIPAGASISGYLTTSSASSTYQTISGMSGYATTSYVTSQGYLTDAPSDGSEYVRKNAAWSVATGGGGGIPEAPAGSDYVRNGTSGWVLLSNFGYQTATDVSTYVTGLGYQTATDVSTYVTGLGYLTSTAKSVNTQTNTYTLAAADANNIVYVPSGSGGGMSMTIFVPEDVTYNFATGTTITLIYDTAGGYTIDFSTTGAGSPTLIGNTGTISTGTIGQRVITKLASNFWVIL